MDIHQRMYIIFGNFCQSACHGAVRNPYDDHTLDAAYPHMQQMIGSELSRPWSMPWVLQSSRGRCDCVQPSNTSRARIERIATISPECRTVPSMRLSSPIVSKLHSQNCILQDRRPQGVGQLFRQEASYHRCTDFPPGVHSIILRKICKLCLPLMFGFRDSWVAVQTIKAYYPPRFF